MNTGRFWPSLKVTINFAPKPEQAIITDGNAPWTGGHGYEKQSH
jgi:hypothetical protein